MSENEMLHYLHWLLWDTMSPWSDCKHALLLLLGYQDQRYRNLILSAIYRRDPITNQLKKNLKRMLPDILAGKITPQFHEKRTAAEDVVILWPNPPKALQYPKWDRSKELCPGFDFIKRRA